VLPAEFLHPEAARVVALVGRTVDLILGVAGWGRISFATAPFGVEEDGRVKIMVLQVPTGGR